MDVTEALRAICSTGEGSCWYCDLKLPEAGEAIGAGWDVKRLDGERLAGIILICPMCQQLKAKLGEEGFLRHRSSRYSNVTR